MLKLTAEQARQVLLAAQGLDRPRRRKATKADVLAAIRRMGALQIDTIHVVARSPYLVLWSRLGDYDPAWLEQHLAEGRLFEYWSHEASFLPSEDYALYRHRMIDPGGMGWKYSHAWLERHRDVVEHVHAEIERRGPLRSADFERKDGQGSGWWNWKPEKRALELLFTSGDLMVARRERFQRVYDLRERVLPAWSDAQLPPVEMAEEGLIRKAALALGVATTRWLADYFRMPPKRAEHAVAALAARGELVPVEVGEWPQPGWASAESLALLEQAQAGELRATLTTVLSPFDPIVWQRARLRAMFGFDYSLECYTPAPKRRYGYFVLPILRKGRLVARMDAKAHRAAGQFEVIRLFLEDTVRVGEALAADLGRVIARLARWHETPEVVVRRSTPAPLAAQLRRALTRATA